MRDIRRTKLQRSAASAFWLMTVLMLAGQLAQAQQIKVYAADEISGAGYKSVTTTDDTGKLPHHIKLPAGATSISFAIVGGSELHLRDYPPRCTAPCITVDDTDGNLYNDADGVGSAGSLNVLPDLSISGIQAPVAGFVAGVFESAPPTGDAPPTLDFNTIGTGFLSLSPVLQQLFFIGDGLTGDGSGSVQVFYVPSGAKLLYLGIPDACYYNGSPSCYEDNVGDFLVSYAISTESGLPQITLVSPASGRLGSSVSIWGYNLLSATAVSFNGVPAQFTVETTLINVIVPAGATTGSIEITTPNGTASDGHFTVEP
ncbi:MAG: hypothetical protein ACLPH3_25405 [Terracidiphilus sp.]